MNKLLLVTIAMIIGESSVWACQSDKSTDRLVCPGDKIVTSQNRIGTVAGVNAFSGRVSIDVPYYGNYNDSLEDISLAFGCSNNFCVDDVAVTADGKKGTVVGINPNKGRVVISVPYYGIYDSSMADAYVGMGCVNGICAKDDAITPDGRAGTISGINIYSGKVSIEVPYYGTYEYDSTQMFVKNACLDYDSSIRANAVKSWAHQYNFGLQRNWSHSVPIEPIAPIVPPPAQTPVVYVPSTRDQVPIVVVPPSRDHQDQRDRWYRNPGPVYRSTIQTITVSCASSGYDMGKDFFGNRAKSTMCNVNGKIVSAYVSVQQSGSPCILNSTWGFISGGNQIWVQRGCRAQFAVQISAF